MIFKIGVLIAILGVFGMMSAMFLSLFEKEEFSDKVFKTSSIVGMIGLILVTSVVLFTLFTN